ncbi:MAG: class I SAM-dependent methyltransferase, partial [Acutalibacter sp.]|nr:class I SAM-dependent methyltransferase [Acutalibacter sp.]
MAGYSIFAQFYDRLTANVNYSRQADYLMELMGRLGHTPGLTLDLACGTGSLTLELFRRGLDVYGVDASVEMLSLAREKCADAEADILFLRQNMQELDLYGTVP